MTNNASEQVLNSPKLHQKVSCYWHTLTTLTRSCRVRSYLVSARKLGLRSIDAIHAASSGRSSIDSPRRCPPARPHQGPGARPPILMTCCRNCLEAPHARPH